MDIYRPTKFMIKTPKIKTKSFNDWNINFKKMHNNIYNFLTYLPCFVTDHDANITRLHGIIYEALKMFSDNHKWSWSVSNDIVHNVIETNIWKEKHFTPTNKIIIVHYIISYLSTDFLLKYIA